MFVGFVVIEIRLFNQTKKQKMKSITPVLRGFLDFFQISLGLLRAHGNLLFT